MSERAGLRITLPENPAEGYEVSYFSIGYDRVQSYRLKYHIRATWQEVCGDSDIHGADFLDQWQVFEGDYFTGRILDWDISKRFENDKDRFEQREDAENELRRRLLSRAESLEEQARECRERAAVLEG